MYKSILLVVLLILLMGYVSMYTIVGFVITCVFVIGIIIHTIYSTIVVVDEDDD